MNKLSLDNIDTNFSLELLALMGEWLTFFAIKPHIGVMQDERPSLRGFFKMGLINAHGAFTDELIEYGPPNKKISYYPADLLESYGITKEYRDGAGTPNYQHIKPIVSYDAVKQTFRENFSDDKKPIFPWFASYCEVFIPTIESTAFSCDAGCYPLIKAFCSEGYMEQRGEVFFWTTKVRPIMEALGAWKSLEGLERFKLSNSDASKSYKLPWTGESI